MNMFKRILHLFVRQDSQHRKEIEAELAFHLEQAQRDYEIKGYSIAQSREKAHQQFGDVQKIAIQCLHVNGISPLEKLIIVALVGCVFIGGFWFVSSSVQMPWEWKKVSPFEAVEWKQQRVNVSVDEKWYKLESINGYSLSQILSSSKRQYHEKWKKRFIEDIYEVLEGLDALTGMVVEVEMRTTEGVLEKKSLTMTTEKRAKTWLHVKLSEPESQRKYPHLLKVREYTQKNSSKEQG